MINKYMAYDSHKENHVQYIWQIQSKEAGQY